MPTTLPTLAADLSEHAAPTRLLVMGSVSSPKMTPKSIPAVRGDDDGDEDDHAAAISPSPCCTDRVIG